MSKTLEMVITIAVSVLASSGFWAFIMKMSERKSAQTKLLLGLAEDRIVTRGLEIINRGFITTEEYETVVKYLGDPYLKCGGNGSGKKVIDELKRLTVRK